ncbi:MAG: site-specific DNA-methyltransferase [Oscillospiraceae bacterium]|jgi:DNA modification methylase|nr:site-specific DNA-methyltransferase [Oscillospiraceae bacterium]
MGGQKAQLCVTSPPYGIGGTKTYESGTLDEWFETMRAAIKNICRNADVVCYNIADKFNTGGQFIEPTFAYSVQLFADSGFRPLWVRIWNKQRKALSSSAPFHLASLKPVGDSEYVAAFSEKEPQVIDDNEVDISEHSYVSAFANHSYKLIKRLSKQERREWGYSSIWNFPSVTGTGNPKDRLDERNHRARFPVTLPWRCIKMHSDKGNIVLESFCGTGTTIVASEQTERKCFAIEREPLYCDISVARYHAFAPDAEIFLLRGGETMPFSETNICV